MGVLDLHRFYRDQLLPGREIFARSNERGDCTAVHGGAKSAVAARYGVRLRRRDTGHVDHAV